MKFVFNDSLTASIKSEDTEGSSLLNFVSSGLILEKKIILAGLYNTVDDLVKAWGSAKDESARRAILNHPDAKNLLQDVDKQLEFNSKISTSGGGGSRGSSSSEDPIAILNEQLLKGSENVGKGAEAFAPFLSQKDQIIARLKPFMSDNEIGEVFYRFSDEVKLPFTETIGILEFCIQKSRSCYAKVKDLIDFYLDHYSQKRQGANTKRIIDTACEYQKLNPTVDIFSVLRDAVKGNQPKVNLGYLSKDPDSQLVFNNLIMLSQASLPEQSEEIRRRFQASRDALQNAQEKVNMQRAIYDMMKTEEMNLQLEKMITALGGAFKALLTNPMLRAIKDMFYDLKAGGILLNQLNSILGPETSPSNPRITYPEQQIENENVFPTTQSNRQPFSNNQYNFLKLASPELQRHIYAQTAPAKPKATSEQTKQAETALEAFLRQIDSTYKEVIGKVTGIYKDLPDAVKGLFKNTFLDKLIKFFEALFKVFKDIIRDLKNGSINMEKLVQYFEALVKPLMEVGTQSATSPAVGPSGPVNTNATESDADRKIKEAFPNAYKKPDGMWYRKNDKGVEEQILYSPLPTRRSSRIAQRYPQVGTTYPGSDKTSGYISTGLGIITSIGTLILGSIMAPKLLSSMIQSGNFQSIFNGIGMTVLFLKSTLIELFMALNIVGGNAPQSQMFFDNNGNLTSVGTQILSNNRETMIALGVSDADAASFGKFAVQKVYYMDQLRIKESNLQNAESQAVQTGNPRSPETTVGDLPADFQNKLKDFLTFVGQIEIQFKANVTLLRNALKNAKNLDQAQQAQATGLLAALEKDLIEIQAKKAEWSSMKNIAAHMMRKRTLLQKLKPLQTQLDTLKKLGIPMANIIASPNGILVQVSRIRAEEQQALEKLRKEYYEKVDLLKNPDKVSPMMKLPTDTGITKLPLNPDQSPSTESPFKPSSEESSAAGEK